MSVARKVQHVQKKVIEERTFSQFPDPKGTKIEKIPLENIFITYLGTNNDIEEITICQKKIDENNNTYYLELITKNKYFIDSKDKINVLKTRTLLSLLNETYLKDDLKHVLKNGYLTHEDIINLHDKLNEDQSYKTEYYSRGDGPVYHDKPTFLNRYKDMDCIIEKDDENLSNLIIKLITGFKIPILNGDNGIGKSTLINKLNYFIKKQSNYYINKEIWKINYQDLIKNIITKKHLKSRIKNTITFLEGQPDSVLFIDDVDFNNQDFINEIKKYSLNPKTKIVLIPKNKINEEDLDKEYFTVINITHQKEDTQRKIIKKEIKKLREKTIFDLNLTNEEEDELITILLNISKTDSLNNNYDKNPSLAIKILENAFNIALAYNQSEVYLYNLYYALSLDNINIAKDAHTKAITSIDALSTKVNARKQQEKENKKKSVKEKIKSLFRKDK